MRLPRWIMGMLVVLFLLVLSAGIYRFNFTNDDIYVQLPDGSVVPWDEREQQHD